MIFLQVCLTSPKCFTNYEPRVQSPLSERIVGDTEQWTLDISFLDKAAVSKNQLLNRGTYVLQNIICSKNRQMSIDLFIYIYVILSTNWYMSMAHCMCILFFIILIIFLFLHSTSHVYDLSSILHFSPLKLYLIFYILYFILSLLIHVFDQFYSCLLLSYVSCLMFHISCFIFQISYFYFLPAFSTSPLSTPDFFLNIYSY